MAKRQGNAGGHQHQAVSGRRIGAGYHQMESGVRFGITGCLIGKTPMGRPVHSNGEGLPSHRQQEGSGLLRSHLVVVMMVVMVMIAVMMPVVMTMMMMLLNRSRISAGGAEDRHGECQGQTQPERREEGLLHDFVSFLRGRSGIHRIKSVTQAPR